MKQRVHHAILSQVSARGAHWILGSQKREGGALKRGRRSFKGGAH